MQQKLGNLLGSAQAEADRLMLARAFIETADYQALLHTTDFSYVVGRRGTGKSAIFQKLTEVFAHDTGLILISEEPQDFEMLQLYALLARVSSDYRILRATSRLLWTVNFLLRSASAVVQHYRFTKSIHSFLLLDYLQEHRTFLKESGAANCIAILRPIIDLSPSPEEIPEIIASMYQIGKAGDALREALDATGLRVITLYDRLDEAWVPEIGPVAILGGIAKMAADYREKHFPFYPVLFIRDNMFRALAQFDDDFTRHIEGHSLRLQWDEESLFHLVAARLRVCSASTMLRVR
jgi:hypothetical protein